MKNLITYCYSLLCCLFAIGIKECLQLVIKSVNVPPTVKAIDTDYIILDCDYDLENTSSKGLVVKWFYDNNKVAYQWIYGRDPLAEEPVKKYIDLTYKASDNPLTQYRAMKLNNPGVDLTGVYTCVISTFADERTENASMIVYSTAKKFDFVYRKKSIEDKDGVEVTCLAEGLYPEPTLNISVEGSSNVQTVKPIVTIRADGLYDILSRMTLLDDDIPKATVLKCLLSIPKANYNVSRKSVYYSGISTTTSTATTKLLGKMDIQNSNSQPGNGGGCSSIQTPISLLFVAAEAFLFSIARL